MRRLTDVRYSAGAESQHWPQIVAAPVAAATAVGMVAGMAWVTMLRAMTMWATAEASIWPQSQSRAASEALCRPSLRVWQPSSTFSAAAVRMLALALALESVRSDEMVPAVWSSAAAAWPSAVVAWWSAVAVVVWSALAAIVRPTVVSIVAIGSAPLWTPL